MPNPPTLTELIITFRKEASKLYQHVNGRVGEVTQPTVTLKPDNDIMTVDTKADWVIVTWAKMDAKKKTFVVHRIRYPRTIIHSVEEIFSDKENDNE